MLWERSAPQGKIDMRTAIWRQFANLQGAFLSCSEAAVDVEIFLAIALLGSVTFTESGHVIALTAGKVGELARLC